MPRCRPSRTEQSLDRDRRAARGPRHLGQFRARPRQRRRDHDDRPRDGARRDDPREDVAGRRCGRRDHREGQIAPHARQGDRDRPRTAKRRDLLFVRAGRSLHGRGARHRRVEKMVGRPKPDMYSADLSLFVLDAGIRLVEQGAPSCCISRCPITCSTATRPTNPRRSNFTPRSTAARAAGGLGCTVALTADHGMNDKALPDGRPHVIFLQDLLNAHFGAGSVRVICPITDPFVRHHGALGSFVRVIAEDRAARDIGACGPRAARHRCGADPRRGRRAVGIAARPRGRSGRHRRPQHGDRRDRGRARSVGARGPPAALAWRGRRADVPFLCRGLCCPGLLRRLRNRGGCAISISSISP